MGERLKLYWCGWNVPNGLPDEDLAEKWAPHMMGYRTGYGDDYATYAGAVWARTPEEAMSIVRSNYGKHAPVIDERWEPELKDDDWLPNDRFDPKRMPRNPNEETA